MRSPAQGLVCGIIAQQVFGIADAIAPWAKMGMFFWVAVGSIAAMYWITQVEMRETQESPDSPS
jgi:hypothetical protein